MASTYYILIFIFFTAVVLDLLIVRGMQRFRRFKREATDQDDFLKLSKRELFWRAFFKTTSKADLDSHRNKAPKISTHTTATVVPILLMLVGIIQLRKESWVAGSICIILAMVGFVLNTRRIGETPFSISLTSKAVEPLRPLILTIVLWIVIFILLFTSILTVADNFVSAETNYLADAAWVVSIILGMITVWWGSPRLGKAGMLWGKIKTNRAELIFLFFILVLAFFLRTVDLSVHPYPWSGDEASMGNDAARILSGEVTNFFDTGWSSQPNWSFVPTAITEAFLGKNILAVRIPSATAGILAVIFVYLVGRELFHPIVGLIAGFFLASLPYHVHFSRLGVNNVMDSFMSALMLWLIIKAIKKDDLRYYFSAGIAAGLGMYTYAGTRLILILGGITFLFLIVRYKGYLLSHWKHLAAFFIATVISAAPEAAYFARHKDIFMGRLGQEGILLNGWLTQQMALTSKNAWEILFDQFFRTTMVFIASAAPGNFFNSPIPYLTILGSLFFLLGMGYALAHLREPQGFIVLSWFWVTILFGGILTTNPPANQRLLMTSPPMVLFMAVGLFKVFEQLEKSKTLSKKVIVTLFAVTACLITYQNTTFYMLEYKNKSYFTDVNGEFAMEIGLLATQIGDDYPIYVLGVPRVFAGFPTTVFVAPDNPRSDLSAEDIATFELPPDGKAVFFAIPENSSLLQEIILKFPGGNSGLFYRKTNLSEILFEYYILGQETY